MYVAHGCFVTWPKPSSRPWTSPWWGWGGSRVPELADRILKEGRADVVAMGRALIADPMLPEKAAPAI
jgi:2,4-dienoyl-CoA reductase-like NADH-dependent reductase (Old Yellow Enzyme family)